jgi:predicted PurR-regulated permease PerM
MTYLLLLTSIVIVVGLIVGFILVDANFERQIHVTNERLNKMFEFLKNDISKSQIKIEDLEIKLKLQNQKIEIQSKTIESLENVTRQLRSGSQSKLY